MKKLLTLLLSFALICIFSLTAFAAINQSSDYTEGDYTYTVENKEATIIAVNKENMIGDISIPETLGGYPVVAIGNLVFLDCGNLFSVVIPDTVRTINTQAFYRCGIKEITIPASVTTIGETVFQFCDNLKKINVDENNTKYSSDESGVLFNKDKTELIRFSSGSELTEYTVPDSVTHIYFNAFFGCFKLTDVTVGRNVTTIGEYAFHMCNNLTMHGYKGSYAEKYATRNNIWFEEIVEESTVNSGDLNGDGDINNKDLGLLMQYLNGWNVKIVVDAADTNADDTVNNKDYGLLMQYVNGWNIELNNK